jgi:hypothetical protein
MNSEETDSGGIDACDDKIGADLALVAEKVLLEHGHACYDARLTAGGESVKFEVRRYDGGGEFSVGGGAGPGTPDLGGDVVEFLAVLGNEVSSMLDVERELNEFQCTLSATMGPDVALVSAAITTPPSNMQPTMVLVACQYMAVKLDELYSRSGAGGFG